MKSPIITRFAPSPTGYLHVGGARTALFNWLLTRQQQGTFILRVEDTDVERSTQASVDAIFEALEWLGLDWDQGPFFQSQRREVYQEYLTRLVNNGQAYTCDCTAEEVEAMRQKALASGGKPRYDGRCRDKGLTPAPGRAVRFRCPQTGTTVLEDCIKGAIAFQNAELDDFVIQRSDGMPTYNFAVVVDDHSMGVTTILRGDDHVNNTPKQMLIFKALGGTLPVFGHLPMVLGPDRARLSKRHGATSVTAWRDMGYLPDALINYLARLGWSHGDQEFFTRQELIERFDLAHVGRSAGIFDAAKLLALNADHIQAAPLAVLARHLLPHLQTAGYTVEADSFMEQAIQTLQPRSKTLLEMTEGIRFYFDDPLPIDAAAAVKFLTPATRPVLKLLTEHLTALDTFSESALEAAFKTVMETTGLKLGKVAQPVRVALTGRTVSPGIFEIIAVLGKNRTLTRLQQAIQLCG